MVEAPKVYCPQEGRDVPIWWCLGSFVQQRTMCPEVLEATVKIAEDFADVKCGPRKRCKGGVDNA